MRLSWERKYKRKGTAKGKNAKKKKNIEFKWSKKTTANQSKHLIWKQYHTHCDLFSTVTNFDAFVKIIIQESNLYDQQNGRKR